MTVYHLRLIIKAYAYEVPAADAAKTMSVSYVSVRSMYALIHIKAGIDPAAWFHNDKKDVRSSYYLEDVATEFDIQGLELDWTAVCWDADFRRLPMRGGISISSAPDGKTLRTVFDRCTLQMPTESC